MVVVRRRVSPFSYLDIVSLQQIYLKFIVTIRGFLRFFDVRSDLVLPRGLALLEKGFLRQCIANWSVLFHDDGQSSFLTEPIAFLANPMKILFRRLILAATLEIHGIDDDVIMNMLLVRMRVDDGFMPFGDGSSEFLPDLVRLFGCHFPWLKGLNDMMGLNPVRFAP
nr:hypothetical protein [Exiguobacterium sp. s192]